MSVHNFPSRTVQPERSMAEIMRLCGAYIGRVPTEEDDGVNLTLTFTPDLDPGEEDTLRRVMRVGMLMRITPAEWAAIEGDISGLRTYDGLSSPTNAQSVAAIKALIHVMRALMRD